MDSLTAFWGYLPQTIPPRGSKQQTLFSYALIIVIKKPSFSAIDILRCCPDSFNIKRCVRVPVVVRTATMASPLSVFQRQRIVDYAHTDRFWNLDRNAALQPSERHFGALIVQDSNKNRSEPNHLSSCPINSASS